MDDKERELDRDELRRRMEETRQSMSETVGEIKQEIAEAFEWRTYLRRYPGAFLVGAGIAGVLIGRALTPDGSDRNYYGGRSEPDRESWEGSESYVRARPSATSETEEKSDSLIHKAGGVIAAAVMAELAPIVSNTLRRLFRIDRGSSEGEGPSRTWTH